MGSLEIPARDIIFENLIWVRIEETINGEERERYWRRAIQTRTQEQREERIQLIERLQAREKLAATETLWDR